MASAFTWAASHVTPLTPAARHASALVRRVAAALAAAGGRLQAVPTANGSEFRSQEFRRPAASLGAEQRDIRTGRSPTNGGGERVQRTILEAGGRPPFTRVRMPTVTAPPRDLVANLGDYHHQRPHTGTRTHGLTPTAPWLRGPDDATLMTR